MFGIFVLEFSYHRLVFNVEGLCMEEDYKSMIIELVQKIDDVWVLDKILKIIKAIVK